MRSWTENLLLRGFVVQRKLHLEWLHDPPTQLHGIPTKGGKGITAWNFVNELVAQRNIRMINYNRLHTEFSIRRVWNIFVPLRFFDYVLFFLDHPLIPWLYESTVLWLLISSSLTFCSTIFYRTVCLLLYSLPLLLFYRIVLYCFILVFFGSVVLCSGLLFFTFTILWLCHYLTLPFLDPATRWFCWFSSVLPWDPLTFWFWDSLTY